MTDGANKTLLLAQALIRRASVTPEDGGCQALIAERLSAAGFGVESLVFGEVTNLWARRGNRDPLFVFLGHTDVVPPGPDSDWISPPFEPAIREGMLYGRGAADMKGSVAAFVTALERFVTRHPQHSGAIGMLITSDEEGPAIDGTVKVMEALAGRGERIRWCLVGEPSSRERLGDVVKNGRRGSLTGRVRLRGLQGHVAYPEQVNNPIHGFARAFAALADEAWDSGNAHFPPTSFQVSNVNAGTGVENVVPGTLDACFNFRYSTEVTPDAIKQRVASILDNSGVEYAIDWTHGARPFLTEAGALVEAVSAAVHELTGDPAALTTEGGTSDGRFVAPTGAEVVELGPINATIHCVNECVRIKDLEVLSCIYERVMERLLVNAEP